MRAQQLGHDAPTGARHGQLQLDFTPFTTPKGPHLIEFEEVELSPKAQYDSADTLDHRQLFYFELRNFAALCDASKIKNMSAKDDTMNQFISAMIGLTGAIGHEAENCCRICGAVSEKELRILIFVGDNDSVKMSEISEYLKVPLSTLTSIADKLVANKFLVRYNSEEDRRVVKVALGEKGRESYQAFLTRKKAMSQKVLAHFSEKEQTILINNINKLAAAMVS